MRETVNEDERSGDFTSRNGEQHAYDVLSRIYYRY